VGDGSTAGTLQFMAPEQARGECARVGAASDIFALGGLLYFLLTGQPPFVGRTAAEIRAKASRCEFDRASLEKRAIPRRLARIVLRAMAAEPAGRHPRAGDLARELERFVARPRRLLRAATVASGVVSILALLAVLARPWDRATSSTPSGIVVNTGLPRIEMMEVRLVEDATGQRMSRVVGNEVAACRAEDMVRILARLAAPAYCYLIALHPNGQIQLYFPADEKAPPPSLSEIVYPPDPNEGSPLTDGTGLQAFVVLASEQPLPPFREWRNRVGPLPWRSTGPDAEGVWRFDGRKLEPIIPQVRSEPRKLAPTKQPAFDETCRFLADCAEARAIEARAFPVRPGSGPMCPAPTTESKK
jgi:serine/threonine protein kinase